MEYKTQTQINHHQIQAHTSQFQIQPKNLSINPTKSTPNNHIKSRFHPQQPPKIQIKKIKTPKPIRSERERIQGERAHLIWVALLGLHSLGLRRGDSDLSKTTLDPVTFLDGVVFGRKISERCFLLRFLAFYFLIFSRFLLFYFSLRAYKSNVKYSISRWSQCEKKMPHQIWSDHGNRVSKDSIYRP